MSNLPNCKNCDKKLSRKEYRLCITCFGISERGDKHRNWKGGKPKCWCGKILSHYSNKNCRKHSENKMSEEGRKRMSEFHRNRARTEEEKKKISETRKKKFKLGLLKSPHKGKSKYKNEEEKRLADRLSGRKSYRKNIEKRLIYYRQLAMKRRGAKGSFSVQEWNELKIKFNHICPICGKGEPKIKLTIDHIKPISKGGTNNINNIQPLCLKCNVSKNNRNEIRYDPIDGRVMKII